LEAFTHLRKQLSSNS